MKTSIHQRSRGFTLIEVMIAIAIVAAIAAGVVVFMTGAQKDKARQETRVRLKVVEDALQTYHQENGEYPIPLEEPMDSTVNGFSFKFNGAAALYQALTGDGNDKIQNVAPGERGSSKDEWGSTGTVYLTEMQTQGQGKQTWVVKGSEGVYGLADGFKLPWQYRVPIKGKNEEEMFNKSLYDLWSYADYKKPNFEDSREWVKNW